MVIQRANSVNVAINLKKNKHRLTNNIVGEARMKKFRFLNRKIQHKIILDRKFFLTILFCLLLSFSLCVCVFPVITITNYFCNLEKNNKWNDNEASGNCEENKGNNMHFKISNKISIIHLFNSSIDKNSKLKKNDSGFKANNHLSQ